METVKYKVAKAPKRKANGNVPIWHCSWLAVNEQNKLLRRAASMYAHGRLLDIGCGEKPLKSMFAPYVSEHAGVDHNAMFHNKDNVDIFADAYAIPVPDGSFDTVLSTDVLEHLEEPQKAFDEMYRVLVKSSEHPTGGGTLLLPSLICGIYMSSPAIFIDIPNLDYSIWRKSLGFMWYLSNRRAASFCLQHMNWRI